MIVVYRRDLFEPRTVSATLKLFKVMAEAVVREPDRDLRHLLRAVE